jgi:hypothetical protein
MKKSDQISLILALIGVALVMIGAGADILGLDLTPGVGLVQVLCFLFGLTVITVAGFYYLSQHRLRKGPVSLMADVGIRMGMTGLLTCYVCGLADILGVGTHRGVRYDRPYLGPLQLAGFAFGLLVVVIGLVLYWLGNRREIPEAAGSDH